jgi:hypothetical protein
VGSRLFAPNFLLASIVSKNNGDAGVRRKVTFSGSTNQGQGKIRRKANPER